MTDGVGGTRWGDRVGDDELLEARVKKWQRRTVAVCEWSWMAGEAAKKGYVQSLKGAALRTGRVSLPPRVAGASSIGAKTEIWEHGVLNVAARRHKASQQTRRVLSNTATAIGRLGRPVAQPCMGSYRPGAVSESGEFDGFALGGDDRCELGAVTHIQSQSRGEEADRKSVC